MNRYIHSFCFPFCSFISIPFYLCLCIPFLSSKFLACCTACGILDPNQGSKPCTLQWKHRVLTTGRSVSKKKKKKRKKKFCLSISQCILMCFPLVHVHLYPHLIRLFLFPSPPNYPSWIIRKRPFVSSGNTFSKGKMQGKVIHFQRGQVQLSLCLTSTTPLQMPSILCVSGKNGLHTAPIKCMCE